MLLFDNLFEKHKEGIIAHPVLDGGMKHFV
jgi:hypothetical protein